MEIYFKPAEENNWEEIATLEEGSASLFFHPFEGEVGYREYLKESEVFFIQKGEEVVGTISYKKEEDQTHSVNGLTILPEYRRQGLAKKAMEWLLNKVGNKDMALHANPKNTPALMIYLKFGFVISAWKENPFGDVQPRLFLERKRKH